MPVNNTHPEYEEALPRYCLIRAIVNNDAKCYIRNPDPDDVVRNKQYKDDAILTNFTALTLEAFVGLIFSKDLQIQLPPELAYLEDNVTGTNINIDQFAQSTVSELLQVGRYGLLVDFENDAQKAFIKPYAAETIINWKDKVINGISQPYLIVLKECILDDDDDIFSQDEEEQYRVLMLDQNNIYNQLVFDCNLNLESQIIPLDVNGQPFDYIPFVFIGSKNNDSCIDKEPLYDMAVLNLGHYRNSADYEESIWVCGQPYLVINAGDSSLEEFNAANPSGAMYGSRKGLVLASNGSAQLLQANPNQLVAQAMKEKLEQAAKTGARLIEPAGGRETAEAAKIRYLSQHSVLYTLASNAECGIERALSIICQFMGVDESLVDFELNKEFYDETADGNIMTAYTAWFDRGIVSSAEMRSYGEKVGILDSIVMPNEIDMETDPLADPNDIVS